MTTSGRGLRSQSSSSADSQSSASIGGQVVAGYQLIENAWKKAEEKLATLHCPNEVKVQIGDTVYTDPDNGPDYRKTFLSYSKVKNQWRVCVIENDYGFCGRGEEHDDYDCRPVIDWPVEVRIKMFEHFPKLYAAVEQETKDFLPKVKKAVEDFEKNLEWLDI